MSHSGNHLSVLCDKIPVFYALNTLNLQLQLSNRQRDDRTL